MSNNLQKSDLFVEVEKIIYDVIDGIKASYDSGIDEEELYSLGLEAYQRAVLLHGEDDGDFFAYVRNFIREELRDYVMINKAEEFVPLDETLDDGVRLVETVPSFEPSVVDICADMEEREFASKIIAMIMNGSINLSKKELALMQIIYGDDNFTDKPRYVDAAKALGISSNYAYVLHHRAIAKIRGMFE